MRSGVARRTLSTERIPASTARGDQSGHRVSVERSSASRTFPSSSALRLGPSPWSYCHLSRSSAKVSLAAGGSTAHPRLRNVMLAKVAARHMLHREGRSPVPGWSPRSDGTATPARSARASLPSTLWAWSPSRRRRAGTPKEPLSMEFTVPQERGKARVSGPDARGLRERGCCAHPVSVMPSARAAGDEARRRRVVTPSLCWPPRKHRSARRCAASPARRSRRPTPCAARRAGGAGRAAPLRALRAAVPSGRGRRRAGVLRRRVVRLRCAGPGSLRAPLRISRAAVPSADGSPAPAASRTSPPGPTTSHTFQTHPLG